MFMCKHLCVGVGVNMHAQISKALINVSIFYLQHVNETYAL